MTSLRDLVWHRLCAASILFIALALFTVFSVTGFSTSPCLSVCLSLWSMRLLFLMPLLLLWPRLKWRWVRAGILLPIALCFMWQIASVELYAVQCRFFSFEELLDIWSHPETRSLIYDQVISWRVPVFFCLFYGLYFGLEACFKRLLQDRYAMLIVPVFFILIAWGEWTTSRYADHGSHLRTPRLCVMPWSSLSYVCQDEPVARYAVAREQWHRADSTFWMDGAPDYLGQLSGSHQGRSIVIVLLESHGLNYVDGFGEGSYGHLPSSPFLSELAQEHIVFENYFQSGYATLSASWSILSGFPYYHESAYTPHLAKLGPLAGFQESGYYCEWLKSANVLFGNFNELTQNLGIATGPSKQEIAVMRERDDKLWSGWGMPDEQLFEIAFNRISNRLDSGQGPFLEFILTVSNHNPFILPERLDGAVLPRDNSGGMLYADACLRTFMEAIETIDVGKRPIVFITADTGFRSGRSLVFDQDVLAPEPLESLRLPGILVLPEKALGIKRINDVFSHEDLLPFLAELVGVETIFSERFRSMRRIATVINDYEGHTILSKEYCFYGRETLMSIQDYWNLSPLPPTDKEYVLMKQRLDRIEELRHGIWINAGENVLYRDQHWELVESSKYRSQ